MKLYEEGKEVGQESDFSLDLNTVKQVAQKAEGDEEMEEDLEEELPNYQYLIMFPRRVQQDYFIILDLIHQEFQIYH